MSDFGDPADYALTGYLRFWQSDDFHLARRAQGKNGLAAAAPEIARAYGFGRTVPAGKVPCLAKCVDRMVKAWPETLTKRAEACIATAKRFSEKHGGKTPYSGVTKLAWFAKPEGWVPFDSQAAKGLGARGASTEDQLRRFYVKLADHLPALSAKLQPELASLHPGIRPERIVDRYLWLRGMDEDRQRTEFNRLDSFLEAQIPAARPSIEKVRGQVAETFRESDLVKSLDRKNA